MSHLDEISYPVWWRSRLAEISCVGLENGELAAVVADQSVTRLPAAYEGFLKVAGKQCGALWAGSDAFFPALLGLRAAADELLAECETDIDLAANDVVVAMHQGYEFLYLPEGGDDPPVMRFIEGDAVPHEVGPSFTQFVLSALDEISGQ